MKDQRKTKAQLINELMELRQRITELEALENEGKKTDAALQVTNERINYLLTSTSVAIYTSKISGDYGATSITDNVKQMASLRPGIKVLYMSGYTNNATAHHRVLETGMNYIQKPFTLEELARKVREVLDK